MLNHSNDLLGLVSGWFNDQETSDIQVRLKNDQVYHCHRIVLRSWSTVWAAALQDKKECVLDLSVHDAATADICLKYCYTSKIELTDDNLTRVHLFACQYNLKPLQSACEKVMLEGITVTNCMALFNYLFEREFPNMPNSLDVVKVFLCNQFVAASKSDGFLRLSAQAFCDLLDDDILNATEDEVLDACYRWLGDSPKAQVRKRVLKRVRFPMLSAKKLIEFSSNKLFQHDLIERHNFALQWALTQHMGHHDQTALRNKLTEDNKQENLTPRLRGPLFKSQILDATMTMTLSSMLDGILTGKLLVDSNSGTTAAVFDNAVRGKGPFVCLIRSTVGHVFGAYVEDTFGTPGGNVPGSPNNFLFSLKNVPPQQVVKLKRTQEGNGINITNCGLHMGQNALVAFCSHSTASSPCFELAPGYESVGSKTLHGTFGSYSPQFMEVFAVSIRKRQQKAKKTTADVKTQH